MSIARSMHQPQNFFFMMASTKLSIWYPSIEKLDQNGKKAGRVVYGSVGVGDLLHGPLV